MAQRWYCAYTPLTHGLTSTRLIQEAFDTRKIKAKLWLPMWKIKKLKYNTEIDVQVPLFPNYVLIFTEFPSGMEQEMEQQLLELKAGYFLKKVGSLLPAEISEEEIKLIEELERKEVETTQKEENYVPIEIGTYVEVISSPLRGIKGIVVDSTKDTVTIETFLFGRSAPVEVPISILSHSIPTSDSSPKTYHEKKKTDF
jgi:transcription antitermination factor NusG